MIDVELQPGALDWLTLAVATLGAIGTVSAALVAVRVAGRDARKRVRGQATQISVWDVPRASNETEQGHTDSFERSVVITNGSDSSIYEVVVSWGAAQGSGPTFNMQALEPPTCAVMVPPGEWLMPAPRSEGGGASLVTRPAISFIDSAGGRWRRDAKGQLMRTAKLPIDDLGMSRPTTFHPVWPYSRD